MDANNPNSKKPGEQPGAQGPQQGGRHSLDQDEYIAERRDLDVAANPIEPEPDEAPEPGQVWPGDVVSGGAAGQSPRAGKGTSPTRPAKMPEVRSSRHPNEPGRPHRQK